MPFRESNNTEYFYFEHLNQAGLAHGIFSRQGGVSPLPWGSLNTGSRVGDDADRVVENLSRAALALNRRPESLVSVRQVHGNQVFTAEAVMESGKLKEQFGDFDNPGAEAVPEADAIITQNPQTTLFMRFADCVPILLYDPVQRAAGIAHAGWRGTVSKVASRAVEAMVNRFSSRPVDIFAGIGPSICVDHYEVGQNVLDEAQKSFGHKLTQVVHSHGTSDFFDLWQANRLILEQAGVERIETAGECTVEAPTRWFSHRGENGKTGRFVALMGLE